MKYQHKWSSKHDRAVKEHDKAYLDKPITRMEIAETPNGLVFVAKYKEGWRASTCPDEAYTTDDLSFDEIVKWLSDNKWECLTWFDLEIGKRCRAFRDKREPVRTREEICAMSDFIANGQLQVENRRNDLAYWYDFVPYVKSGLSLRSKFFISQTPK